MLRCAAPLAAIYLLLFHIYIAKAQHTQSNSTLIKHDEMNSAGPCKPGLSDIELEITDVQKESIMGNEVRCTEGFANEYPCLNIDLVSFISHRDLNAGERSQGNDVWGWSKNGREFAIVGTNLGASFVEITDPINPVILGKLETQTFSSGWRDIKTYEDHAFIVSEATNHGLQVFDLNQIMNVSSFTIFEPTAHYSDFGRAHNIAINEDSGFAYVVGSIQGSETCNAGLHMIDISTPSNPVFAGCYSDRGYTHDVQCVNYDGPDSTYRGREICFASNEITMDIIDVSDKGDPNLLSIFSYSGARYVHQGWLTEDQRYFLIDDELDEYTSFVGRTGTTYIADVSNLEEPIFVGSHSSGSMAIDHNQFVKGNFVYQANYRAGLRILDLFDVSRANLLETAYFDTYTEDDENQFNGAWSNYPFFDSGIVVISDIEQGLFVVRPDLTAPPSMSPTISPSFFPSQASTSRNIIGNFVTSIVEGVPIIQTVETRIQEASKTFSLLWNFVKLNYLQPID